MITVRITITLNGENSEVVFERVAVPVMRFPTITPGGIGILASNKLVLSVLPSVSK